MSLLILTETLVGGLGCTPRPRAVLIEWHASIAVDPGGVVFAETDELVFFIWQALASMAVAFTSRIDPRYPINITPPGAGGTVDPSAKLSLTSGVVL